MSPAQTVKRKAPPKPMFRVEIPHRRGCTALLQSQWRSPWGGVADDAVYAFANRNGVGRGSHHWLRIRCNSLACHGVLRVDLHAALVALKAPNTGVEYPGPKPNPRPKSKTRSRR